MPLGMTGEVGEEMHRACFSMLPDIVAGSRFLGLIVSEPG